MKKILLKNKEVFQSWRELNYLSILIENDEKYPTNYPCILITKDVEDCYMEKNYIYYAFVYLDDFMD